MDLNYNHLEVTPSSEVRGFENYIKIVKWWLGTHEPSQDFWVRTPISDITNRQLSELRQAVPALGDLRRDFHTFIKIYGVLENTNERWEPNKVGEINNLLAQWHSPHGIRTLKTFWSDAPPTVSNMQFLSRYAQCAKACLEHILEKTRLGKDLVEKFDICRTTTDLLKPMLANIQLGTRPKSDGTNLGKTVLEQQETLKQSIISYFSTPGTAAQIADWPRFAQCFIPNLRVSTPGTIDDLVQALRSKTLHRVLIHQKPTTVSNWSDYGEICKSIESFFSELSNITVDLASRASNRLPDIKKDMLSLDTKIVRLTDSDDDEIQVESLEVLLDEVKTMEQIFLDLKKMGISIDRTTVGIDPDRISILKEKLLTGKRKINEQTKRKQDLEKAIEDRYSSTLKVLKLPEISRKTWHKFLLKWNQESKNYRSPQEKSMAVRAQLIDEIDRKQAANMSYDQIMNYLYVRYGSPSSAFELILSDLEKSPAPTNSTKLEHNLVNTLSAVNACLQQDNLIALWSISRTTKIVNQNFDSVTQRDFWTQFEKLKTDTFDSLLDPPSLENWMLVFDQFHGTERLELLKTFCEQNLSILRNMKIHESSNQSKNINVIDKIERWSCPLCKYTHKNDQHNIRPFLSACQVFRDMSVAKRQEACQKFKYCRVCTSSKESKGHQNGQQCPRAQTFQCKNCKEPASLTHNTLLCNKTPYSSRLSKFGNTPGRGGGRGGRGGGRGGRSGGNWGSYRGRGSNYQRFQNTDSSCQNHHQMVPFGQFGNFPSKPWNFIQPWQGSFSQHFQKPIMPPLLHQRTVMPNVGPGKLFQVLHTFQSVMECHLHPSQKSILVLSDNGSTGSFVDTNLMDSLTIQPYGQWTGVLKTMLQEEKMQIPFYKLEINLSDVVHMSNSPLSKDSKIPIWALGSPNIGVRPEIPGNVLNYLASIFQVPPDLLCSRAANLGLLLGLDCISLLLLKLQI